jgi:hypothetical protein
MSNYIFYQVEGSIQGDLGYLVQGFGSFPTQISKFLGFGEQDAPTVPGTDQLCTRGLRHIKGHSKLYILLGGRFFLRGFGIVGAGLWEFSHRNFEIFGSGGNHMDKRCQLQPSYGHGGSYIFKRTSNYILYQVEGLIQRDLGYLLQGFGSFP